MESKSAVAAKPENCSLMLVVEYKIQNTDLHRHWPWKKKAADAQLLLCVDILNLIIVWKVAPEACFHITLVSI